MTNYCSVGVFQLRVTSDRPKMRSIIFILISVVFGCVWCERLTPGRVNITCGTLHDNTATIYYFGDGISVSAYMPNGKTCAFKQDVAQATWSLKVALFGNSKSKCVMTKMPHRRIYSIEVLARRGSPVFDTDEDEKLLMECNFETYKDETEESLPIIDVKHPPKVVDTHEGKVSNSNYTIELVGKGGEKLKSAEVGLFVRLKVTMLPSREEEGLGFMPVRCEVTTPDGKLSSAILADGCGTGYPFNKKKGFQMIKMTGVSPPFRVFRLHRRKSVNFKCSFVTCKGDCIGSTCQAEDSSLPRLKRDAEDDALPPLERDAEDDAHPPLERDAEDDALPRLKREPPIIVHASTGNTEVEGVGYPQAGGELQMVSAEFLVLHEPASVEMDLKDSRRLASQEARRPVPQEARRPVPQEARRPVPQEARRPIIDHLPFRDENFESTDPHRVTIVHQRDPMVLTRNVKLAVLGTSGVVLLIFVFITLYLLSRLRNIQ
nr:ZPD [Haliotis tuberculata]